MAKTDNDCAEKFKSSDFSQLKVAGKSYDYGTNDYERRQDNCHAEIDDENDSDDLWRNVIIEDLKSNRAISSTKSKLIE